MTGAREYGKALFEITEELHKSDAALADVEIAKRLFLDSPEYVKLLDTPAVAKEERIALISRALGSLDTHLTNLIKMLSERHAVYLFSKIAEEYAALYDESRGIVRAEAVSAVALTEEQKRRLTQRLCAMLGKTVKLKCTVDPAIIGGLKVRYGGTQLDGSIKTRLDSFEEGLRNIVIQ